jgi:hypothetical protein
MRLAILPKFLEQTYSPVKYTLIRKVVYWKYCYLWPK